MPTLTPDQFQEARRQAEPLLRQGMSVRDIAAKLGVGRSTVGQWRKRLEADGVSLPGQPPAAPQPPQDQPSAASPATAPPPPSAPATPVADAATDLLTELKDALGVVRSVMADMRAVGDNRGAAAAIRQIGVLAPVIARLEGLAKDDKDAVRISRADIAAARRSFEDKVRALTARPILCAHCGKELSVAWAEGR